MDFIEVKDWDLVPPGAEVLYHVPDSKLYHTAWFQAVEGDLIKIAFHDALRGDEYMRVSKNDILLAAYHEEV